MEAFEIMEMDMEFLRKLPTPKELKEQFPVSEKISYCSLRAQQLK